MGTHIMMTKKAVGYLIWLEKCTWNGANGYKLIDHPVQDWEELAYRGYDCNIRITEQSGGMKYVRTEESCHDVPMGYIGHVLALIASELARARNIFNNYPCGSEKFDRAIRRLFRGYI